MNKQVNKEKNSLQAMAMVEHAMYGSKHSNEELKADIIGCESR